jgi:hypothetical protein
VNLIALSSSPEDLKKYAASNARAGQQAGIQQKSDPAALAQKLAGTRWEFPLPKIRTEAPPERLYVELLKDGNLRRGWTQNEEGYHFAWKVREGGVVEIHPARDQKQVWLLAPDADMRGGTFSDPDGKEYQIKRFN